MSGRNYLVRNTGFWSSVANIVKKKKEFIVYGKLFAKVIKSVAEAIIVLMNYVNNNSISY